MSRAAEIAAAMNQQMGAGTIRLGNDPSLQITQWETGCLPFDFGLGGGIPRGRFIELFGGYSVLKSYLCYVGLAAVQRQGGVVALTDTEHVFDPEWATELGVDTSELLLDQPYTVEQAVMKAQTLIQNNVDLIVFDSVAAAFPKTYADAEPGSSQEDKPARLAAAMSKGLARLVSVNTTSTIIFTNQTRVNPMARFGPGETTPGGRALPFYASLRLKLSKGGKLDETVNVFDGQKMTAVKKPTHIRIRADVEKSKLNGRMGSQFWFNFDLGTKTIDNTGFVIGQAREIGLIVEKSTGRFTIPEVMEGSVHGQGKLREWVEADEEVLAWLTGEVMKRAE